ncbi:hypothetical protein EG68_03800 [Paragonimus skrjabini miyazakii]|uniref:EDR1/CTR1/ARMC3-like peptidase-like domain-containing protein n=1 Tax=Paragonimus skrjabini miyazakii TaxID=59628 RepID=A0A8S9Z3V9_9TREM|nr:hypothetical protein EG68_03800 [Paragonimus skrjabini miyazakii]
MATGKKAKKDDATTSEVFDPLTIGLHQAESAVLLLRSSEDDVKIRACEALYIFLSKCDENKKAMLSQNICEALFPLLKSEDKVIKRNAAMVFGVLSGYSLARAHLRRLPNYIQTFMKLFQQDEFDTTKEFALLILSNLCLEYTGINELLERKGIPPIIECLKSFDPDIQKNAVDILNLLMQDFEARPVLKSAAGISPLIELLSSEYPIIQETTLRTFSRATQDPTIRTALRDMDALGVFVDLVGKPELNDLHVSALAVISNLLEDVECAKSLINSGGLQALLHFITDRAVYKESDVRPPSTTHAVKDKGGKGKKASPRRSARKDKGETNTKKEDERPSSNTLPEAKIHACRAVMRTARREETRKILHDADAEQMLIALLSHEDEGVRSAAAQAISAMAESSICQDRIAELGGLELLIRMTRSDHRVPKSAGVTAIASLTTGNASICREVASRNSGIEALVSCLQMHDPEVDTITVGGLTALTNLALEEATRSKLIQAVSGKVLASVLRSSSTNTQAKAALAAAALVCEPNTIAQFRDNGGVQVLVSLLESPVAEVRRAACWAVYTLGTDKTIANLIAQSQGIQKLQSMNLTVSKRNQFSELALQRVLDANLEAKFALTGYLDFTDHIEDQFYDPGHLLSASDLLPLSEYLKQPLTDKRPIYAIHICSNPSGTTEEIVEQPEDNMESLEEQPEKSTKSPELVTEDAMEVDEQLMQWLSYATNVIQSLGDPRLQACELGRFIASCFGGSIKREHFAAFRHELSTAELRCKINSNVVPLGCIKLGGHLHRSLLFKFLADHIGLPTNLIRGNYGRTYNEILLRENAEDSRSKIEACIVDLMFSPGMLMKATSSEAREYISVV